MDKEITAKALNCYLCGSPLSSVVADTGEIRFGCYGFKKQVVKCSRCGLVRLYPAWTEEESDVLYSKYSKKSDFIGYKPKKAVSRYIEKHLAKSDSACEVGCGFGGNVKRLKKNGYNVIGIDKDPTVCDGRAILNFDYRDFTADKEKFDFIYAIQVFEHISQPRSFIEWMADNLKTKGKFLLELPNINDPLLKIYKNRAFRRFYWYPYHMFFYSSDTIKMLFREYPDMSIKVTLLQKYGLINHLRWQVFRRPGNLNPCIPALDHIYKFILTRIFRVSDTIVVLGEKSAVNKGG